MTGPKKIFVWDNTGVPGWHIGLAMCEDGVTLAQHCSSSIGFCKQDMGMFPDQCSWKHDLYKAHCPEGYELIWVDDPANHPGLNAAIVLNAKLNPDSAPSSEVSAPSSVD